MAFILFRHGEGDHNTSERFSCGVNSKALLTPKGQEAVAGSARLLKKYDQLTIYSSPLARTRQTSTIICGELGIDPFFIKYDDRLREIEMGDYNEQPVSTYPWYIYDIHAGHSYNGENYPDVQKRLADFINEIYPSQKDNNVLIVSHALPIREMYKMLTGLDCNIRTAHFLAIENV